MTPHQPSLRLFLVRHALSAANLSKATNLALPDYAVPLAPEGPDQATAAGFFLANYLRDGRRGRTRVLCSPYLRARQTAARIMVELADAGVSHDYREEPVLREMSFGLFDGHPDEDLPVLFPREYAHYQKHLSVEIGESPIPGGPPPVFSAGEFWASMPMGESRAQVADRVESVFGSILRDNDPLRPDPVINFVVVTHGITARAFVMQWMHHPYEWYAAQTNPPNASVQLIATAPPGSPTRYEHYLIFEGFRHERVAAQDRREEGEVWTPEVTTVETAEESV